MNLSHQPSSLFRAPRRRAPRGFTLIELMIVIAIVALVSVYAAAKVRDEFNARQAKAAADNIMVVGRAVEAYIGANSGSFSAAPLDITIATLQADGKLPASFVGETPWRSPYSIRIRRAAGGPPYQYEALVVTTNPWLSSSGSPRIDLLGLSVQLIGGAGGMTYDTTGAVGLRGTWGAPNTTPANYPQANAAGKLAYYVSQATNPNDSIYLRRDGLYPMTGTLQMGSQNISNAASIAATGNVWAGGTVTATGNVSAGGTVTASSVAATNTITAGGLITAGGVTTAGTVTAGTVNSSGNVTAANLITSSGDVIVAPGRSVLSSGRLHVYSGENLYLQPFANGSGAPTIIGGGGAAGNLQVNGDIVMPSLAGRANAPTTTSVLQLLPKLVELNNYVVTANGNTVPVPSCGAGGTPSVFILPHVATGVATGGVWGTSVRMIGPVGSNWIVEARDASGASIPSASIPAGNFSAIVRTFCAYS
jgi:prepilin-type N-terminal cleavage/methylation domain-containing protein